MSTPAQLAYAKLYYNARKSDPEWKAAKLAKTRAWRRQHPERNLASNRAWKAKHPGHRPPSRMLSGPRTISALTPEQQMRERKRRRASDRKRRQRAEVRIVCNLRRRLHSLITTHRKRSCNERALAMLGCNLDFFKAWIESHFVEGMSWANYGRIWHIDHKRECCTFDFTQADAALDCFHWTNLRPLFALDNLMRPGRRQAPTLSSP